MHHRLASFALLSCFAALAIPHTLPAAQLPCAPCAGLRLEQTTGLDDLKSFTGLEPGSPLFLAWDAPLDGSADATLAGRLQAGGATPWMSLVFRTQGPLLEHVADLQKELDAAARLAGAAPAGTYFQVVWRPEGQDAPPSAQDYGFLLKRAAVALTGAQPQGKVATQPLAADRALLNELYGQDVGAYLEAVVLQPAPAEALALAVSAIQEADPGQAVVLDALPLPAAPQEALAEAARASVQGIGLTLFRTPAAQPATLVPFVVLAREFAGDLSFDPYSVPKGPAEAWAFVRGKDLALRILALAPEGTPELALRFADKSLRRPTRFPLVAGTVAPPTGQVVADGLEIRIADPGRVALLGLERPTAEEREGVAEKVNVAGTREIPVEEILRQLQAFEDSQNRRLDHYQAVNTTHLRFQAGGTSQSFEATLEGPFFFSREGGTDWAWQNLYLNGVQWRSKTIPEIPLIQPEKAAALPIEITFNKRYRYRLRGSDQVAGRDAWVVEFAPSVGAEEIKANKLYQGTVWVDKALGARLRTRAVQLGLEGEVISNEETLDYSPVDAQGRPAAWDRQSFVLPLRRVAQQILSVVNAATVVERETLLTQLVLNGENFQAEREKVNASDLTMVRDTDQGLRYLVKDESGERQVKEGFDADKLFAAGGVFYDDALDYPLPLLGLNYFSFDFKGTGKQVNAFFGGVLLTVNAAEPRLFGSKFDFGADAFAIGIPLSDTVYRNDEEVEGEEIESRPASFGLKLGRPLGNFVKLGLDYDVLYTHYGRSDNTDDSFILPQSNFLQSVGLNLRFARSGYRASVEGGYSRRSKWDFWGPPGNTDFEPGQKDFLRWEAAVAKNWYFPPFRKLGLEFNYAGGADLDRFSKYEFGFFGGTRVHGYQSNRVRATEVWASHLSYGFEVGKTFRIEAIGDAAWATDEDNDLDRELLAGVGLQGTFIGPWDTVVNLDVGTPVAGPDDGFVLYVVFLKLFK